ncbi:hypothetical protein [Streptomyces sp. enrichment culture]|uniref:hypothetical protein n=1 Tax=Streptomyces sp. enrichment culture TaxID=1795815 RepID=UPI003F577A20
MNGPSASLAVTADAFLFPETAPCPREPMREGSPGGGEVSEISTPFSPRAYCQWEDGTVYDLAPGATFPFWVFFALTVVPLGAGFWHALRDPGSLTRRPGRATGCGALA